jgi:Flp pilus assembly protein TadB
MVIANISLVIGILLLYFVHPAGQVEGNWCHGVGGLMLGLSITVNLFGLLLVKRCGGGESPDL